MAKNPNFNMQIIDNYDYTIEERGNSFTALRKLKWNDNGTERLDIRRYSINSEGDEVIGKGTGFLTEEGPDEMITILLDTGYGKTEDILNSIKDREDFIPALSKILKEKNVTDIIDIENVEEEEEEVLYDTRDLFADVG